VGVKLDRLSSIEITPIEDGAEFRFRLLSSAPQPAVEFVVSAADVRRIMRSLQALQARYIRKTGRPSLRVVTDDQSS